MSMRMRGTAEVNGWTRQLPSYSRPSRAAMGLRGLKADRITLEVELSSVADVNDLIETLKTVAECLPAVTDRQRARRNRFVAPGLTPPQERTEPACPAS